MVLLPLSPSGCAIAWMQKVIPEVCHLTWWTQCSLHGRSGLGVLLDCHPPAFTAAFPSQPLCPDVVSPAKDCAICIFKRGSLAASVWMPIPITHQNTNAFYLFYFFFPISLHCCPLRAEALMLVTAQTSTPASGGGGGLNATKGASVNNRTGTGRENDSVGNSRNTSNFNI